MELKGKTAVITGGASGIGLAMAELFAGKGARVVMADVNREGLEQAEQKIREAGGEAKGIACNVAVESEVESLMNEAAETYEGIDIAVLNAGILRDGLLIKCDRETKQPVGKMGIEQWQSVIDVNLTGVFLTGREAAWHMIKQGRGGIIIPLSSVSRAGNFGQSNYSAAKAGVAALTVVWSKELARYRIRVAGIAPGFIATPMVLKDMKPEALAKWEKQIPIRRLGRPEEIAHTALYIVECDLVTGVILEPDGGIRV
jgi:3-oxoacyl-[acyl-carrier protein] reductase